MAHDIADARSFGVADFYEAARASDSMSAQVVLSSMLESLSKQGYFWIKLTEEEQSLFVTGYEQAGLFFADPAKERYNPSRDPSKAEKFGEHGYTSREVLNQAVGIRQCFTLVHDHEGEHGVLLPQVEAQPEFNSIMEKIHAFNMALLKCLMTLIAVQYGRAPDFFDAYIEQHPWHRLRALSYGPNDHIGRHSDRSLFTLLHTQGEGLYIHKDRVVSLKGQSDRLLVMPGKTLADVTNDTIRETPHFVKVGDAYKQSFAFVGNVDVAHRPPMVSAFGVNPGVSL